MSITGIHPYADKFPMLPDAELDELADSIRTSGLRQPIVVTTDGLILDGRNRYAACQKVGLDPETVVYEGSDLAEYVIDCNVTRRNMTTGARAMATALVLAADGRREDGRWKRGSVLGADVTESRNTWKDAVRQAGLVLDWAADVADQVAAGTMPLDRAYDLAKQRRDAVDAEHRAKAIEAQRKREETIREQKDNDRKLSALTADASPFLLQVEDGSMTIAVAYAAHQEATRKEREAQRQIEMGWRDTCTRIAECVRYLDGGAQYGESFLREFYPHEADFVPDGLRLETRRVQQAIDFLTTIQKGLAR